MPFCAVIVTLLYPPPGRRDREEAEGYSNAQSGEIVTEGENLGAAVTGRGHKGAVPPQSVSI